MEQQGPRRPGFSTTPLDGTDETLRAHALALMFAAGPTLALVALLLPRASNVDAIPWAINASLGLPVAAVLWRWGHRFSDALLHTTLALGVVIVAVGINFGNGGSLSVAATFFFIWVSLYVFLFFEWRVATAHLVFDAVLLFAALTVSHVDAAAAVGLLVAGTSAVVGTVTGRTRAALVRLATIDHLTGLPNRRRLHDALIAETARSSRTSNPFSVIVIDLDYFKAVNDERGHHAGDQLLVDSANAWIDCLRPIDLLARCGGDEFVAVLPDCAVEDAHLIACRLQKAVAAACSIGLATWQPGQDQDEVLRRADTNMYKSKRRGGDQITTDDDHPPTTTEIST